MNVVVCESFCVSGRKQEFRLLSLQISTQIRMASECNNWKAADMLFVQNDFAAGGHVQTLCV